MTTLYEIAAEYRSAAERMADFDLPEDVIEDTLSSMSGAIEQKAQNVAFVLRNFEATAEKIKEAETAMAARRKAIENRAAGLRDYLKSAMLHAGIKKIECPYFALSIAENPPSVVIDSESQIPAEFMRTIPARLEIDKKMIASAIKAGADVPGCHIERGTRLSIR